MTRGNELVRLGNALTLHPQGLECGPERKTLHHLHRRCTIGRELGVGQSHSADAPFTHLTQHLPLSIHQ